MERAPYNPSFGASYDIRTPRGLFLGYARSAEFAFDRAEAHLEDVPDHELYVHLRTLLEPPKDPESEWYEQRRKSIVRLREAIDRSFGDR